MNSFFKCLAQTSPDLRKYLLKELTLLGLNPVSRTEINECEFRANEDQIFEIMYKIRTIEGLKIQIGNEVMARGEKELEKNMKKLPWHAFINPQVFGSLGTPEVKCKSFRSNLFHEKFVSDMVAKFLNQLDLRRSLNELKKVGYNKDIREIPDKSKKISKLLENSHNRLLIQEKNREQKETLDNQHKKEMTVLSQSRQLPNNIDNERSLIQEDRKWPGIFVYLVKDRALISLILNKLSLHKHGFRKYISWGPIKETLISGCLFELNFIEKCRKKKNVKLWDPFCGSGTILLETLSFYLELPIRNHAEVELFDLENIRIINKENHNKFLEKLSKGQNNFLEESTIILLGSDIDKEAIQSSTNNFRNLLSDNSFSEKYLEDNQKVFKIKENPVLLHHSFLGGRIHIFQTDFENIPQMANLAEFSIITNPPYGYRSRSHISFTNLKGTYTRFKNLLRRNLRNLDEIFILYPLDRKNPGSLLKMKGLIWNLVEKFDNGGIEIGLFQLNKEKTAEIKSQDSPEIVLVNEGMIMQKKKKEEFKALQLKKQDPEEKQKRREERFREEKKYLAEAKEWSKKLKFPREVTKKPKKLRRILHRKHKEYIRRKFHKKFIQARTNQESTIKKEKALVSRRIRAKMGKAVLGTLLEEDHWKNEEIKRDLQKQLRKKADKIEKAKNSLKTQIKKPPRTSKW